MVCALGAWGGRLCFRLYNVHMVRPRNEYLLEQQDKEIRDVDANQIRHRLRKCGLHGLSLKEQLRLQLQGVSQPGFDGVWDTVRLYNAYG